MNKLIFQLSVSILAMNSVSLAGTIDKEYLLRTSPIERAKVMENDNAKTANSSSPSPEDKCTSSCCD